DGLFENIRVERAAESAVPGQNDHPHPFLFPLDEQGVLHFLPAGKAQENGIDSVSVRTRVENRFLSTAQLRGRDHLHGARDLTCALDGTDALTNVFEASHFYTKLLWNSSKA